MNWSQNERRRETGLSWEVENAEVELAGTIKAEEADGWGHDEEPSQIKMRNAEESKDAGIDGDGRRQMVQEAAWSIPTYTCSRNLDEGMLASRWWIRRRECDDWWLEEEDSSKR